MTWKPADGMNKKQIEKELQKQAILFEDKCMKGQVTANIKFQDFAEQWFEEYAKLNLRNTSYERMKQLTVRVYPAIGHLRLDKITSRHIQQFINDLALNGKSLKNGRPLSRKTAVHHLSFISDVFSYAVKMEMLTDIVMCSIRLRREQEMRSHQCLTSRSTTRTKDSPKQYKGQVKDRRSIRAKRKPENNVNTSFSGMCDGDPYGN